MDNAVAYVNCPNLKRLKINEVASAGLAHCGIDDVVEMANATMAKTDDAILPIHLLNVSLVHRIVVLSHVEPLIFVYIKQSKKNMTNKQNVRCL